MNLLLDNLHDDLIISDDAENSSEGAVAWLLISEGHDSSFSDFAITQDALDRFASGPVSESVFW